MSLGALYVAILAFLPISKESNSEEVQNRANEIDNNLVINDFNNTAKKEYDPLRTDNVDYIASKIVEKIALFKEQQDKKIEKKVDEAVDKKEEKDEEKLDNTIEAEDYTFIGDSVMKMGEKEQIEVANYITAALKNAGAEVDIIDGNSR